MTRTELSEKFVRDSLTATFDACNGCRECVDLCGVFPTLFELLDAQAAHGAERLTPAEQDLVVDGCVNCRRCVGACPLAPGRDPRAIDVPSRMLDAAAMRYRAGQLGSRRRRWAWIVARPSRIERLVRVAGTPNSLRRRFVAALTGVSVDRPLPAARRKWSGPEARTGGDTPRADDGLVVVPMCVPGGAGRHADRLVADVAASCGRSADLVGGMCCGAPSLYSGDLRRFERTALDNVGRLGELAGDRQIVVVHPTCAVVMRDEYPRLLGDVATDVAGRIRTPAETFASATVSDDGARSGAVIVYHASGHAEVADPDGCLPRLLEHAGHEVAFVSETDGTESLGHLRADLDDVVSPLADRCAARIRAAAGADAVVVTDGSVVAGEARHAERPPARHAFDFIAPRC